VRSAASLLLLIAGGATAGLPVFARTRPAEAAADAPSALSVTVYRAPYRASGSIDLDRLEGFALVSETRAVHLPAGESRLRFEGVADGIEPASAIVTGLKGGVLEKNRDAALLSPATLVAAALGRPVELIRTNPKTGKVERRDATILAGGDTGDASGSSSDGVVMQTVDGIEALRCSGLPETFSFESAAGLESRPTLSVRVRTAAPVTAQLTLSYLARGFDWAADYTATLAPDGRHMDLGAWVTLANGNGVGFPQAHTQVVAGRVNREQGTVEPIDLGGPIVATCWPRGSTSDTPEIVRVKKAMSLGMGVTESSRAMAAPVAAMAGDLEEIVTTAVVKQEQLGDLKLYRVPETTTVASRQSKQVRLLDRGAIPVVPVYGAEVSTSNPMGPQPASWLLRTKNTDANHLGLPLPSGRVAVFLQQGGQRLLAHESDVHDLAVDEDVEIGMGDAPDVQVTATQDGDSYRDADAYRVDIANARPEAIQFELTLNFNDDSVHVRKADRPMGTKNGHPIFRVSIPANSTATIRYQTTENGARGARRSPKK
jgi:hypothetical protein